MKTPWHVALLPLTWILASPSMARADADSDIALGLGMHGGIHLSSRTQDDSAAAVGAQIRLKLAQIISLRAEYSKREQTEQRPALATTLAQLVAYPDLRMTLGVSPIPNAYFSPFLSFGAGLNTSSWDPVFVAAAGAEVTIRGHWVLGASVQVFYAMPKRYIEFAQRTIAAGQDVQLSEVLTPQTCQVIFELTYYL